MNAVEIEAALLRFGRAGNLSKRLRHGDEERDPCQRHLLRLQNDFGEPDQPAGDIQRLLVGLELVVVGLPFPLDRVGQRDQARLSDVLGEGLFRQGSAEATIAILEGVDAFEPELRQCMNLVSDLPSKTGKR